MEQQIKHGKTTEARYAYYRRCQEFCQSGEQCKAPAEKGAAMCHAHTKQRAMAERRETERRAVLAAAAAEMSRRAKKEFEMADLFTSFNGIQVTIATVAQALVDGRIDCKTAGRLLWDLQRMAKLLRMAYPKNKPLPLINTDGRDSVRFAQPGGPVLLPISPVTKLAANQVANEYEKARLLKPEVLMFPPHREWPNGPPGYAKAA
ncbi:MAG TPA: hypothetical protein VGK22_15485 [Candidatus Angelobacter sp.]|jgi:hypothetical protein